MAVGLDGQGWIGRDKNGKTIQKSNEQLRFEWAQREADAQRAEKLYVAEEYQLFFLTKQPSPDPDDERNAHISIKPFSAIPFEALDEMRKNAAAWEPATSQVRIEVKDQQLVFHDDITKTQSTIYIGELDPDVRQRLRAGQGAEQSWNKLFTAAAAANPVAAVTTKDDVAVIRPLSFKKPVL